MGDHSHIRTQPAESRPRRAVPGGWRVHVRVAALALLAALALVVAPFAGPARAEPVKGEISVDTSKGYARIVFRFSEEIDADVHLANNILVISFKTKVS